jgi:hypothetical protein
LAISIALVPVVAGAAGNRQAPGDTPEMRGQAEAAFERARQRDEHARQQRGRPEQVARRQRSRSEFRDQRAREAWQSARDELDLGRPHWQRLQGVRRYLSDHAAVVTNEGEPTVVMSSAPLLVPGTDTPVDLTLEQDGGALTARHGVVPLRVAADPQDGLSLGSGLSVRPSIAASPEPVTIAGNSAFYANVSTDTDYLIEALPEAVEASWVIRSPNSAEHYELDFTLPSGAHLAETDVPGRYQVRSGEEILATIDPPAAHDADGVSLPVQTTLLGDRVQYDIAHRDADVRYPAELDPVLTYGAPVTHWDGWDRLAYNCGGTDMYTTTSYMLVGWSGGWVSAGCYGRWRYHSPGTSYVYEFDTTNLWHDTANGYDTGTHYGIMNGNDTCCPTYPNGRANYVWSNGLAPPYDTEPAMDRQAISAQGRRVCIGTYATGYPDGCPDPGGPAGTIAFFGQWNHNTAYYGAPERSYVYDMYLHMGDTTPPPPPTITGIPSGWTNSVPASYSVTAEQHGLGISAIGVNTPDLTSSTASYAGIDCGDSYRHVPFSPCPETPQTKTFPIDQNPADGIHTLYADAHTPVAVGPGATAALKIDTRGPNLDISGPLAANSDRTLTRSSYSATIVATDGEAGDAQSGIASIDVLVDGVASGSSPMQTDPSDNAPLTRPFDYLAGTDVEGTHEIEIVAKDRAGNETRDEFDVYVDHVDQLPPQTLPLGSAANSVANAGTAEHFGQAAADLGDVNADGLDDYAVGAPDAGPAARSAAGAVYIVSGTSTGSARTVAASTLAVVDGPSNGSHCGAALATANDADGDGTTDLVIGCPGDVGGLTTPATAPAVFVVFGPLAAHGATIDLGSLGGNGYRISGPSSLLPSFGGARGFGAAVASEPVGTFAVGGDVNDDGRSDVVIGSSAEMVDTRLQAGRAYVIFGKADTATVDVTNLGSSGFVIDGPEQSAMAGFSVSMAGDVNGDDLDDVLVGAPGSDANGRTDSGSAFVVYGKMDTQRVQLATLGAGYRLNGPAAGSESGSSVSGAGDVNLDDRPDILVSRIDGADVSLVDTMTDLALADGTSAISLNGPRQQSTPGGIAVTQATGLLNLNDDARPDFAVSISNPEPAGSTGKIYAVYASEAMGNLDMRSMRGDQGTVIEGPTGRSRPFSVAGLDTTSANGDPGVLVGDPQAGGASEPGSAYAASSSQMTGSGHDASNPCAASSFDGKRWACAKNPYPFAFTLTTGPKRGRTNLPFKRYTAARRWEYTPSQAHDGTRTQFFQLLTNPNRQDHRDWDWVDSYGQRIGRIVQSGSTITAYKQDGTTVLGVALLHGQHDDRGNQARTPVFEVQGQGCVSGTNSDYFIVNFASGANRADYPNRTADGTYIGLRAFVNKEAIPASKRKGNPPPDCQPPHGGLKNGPVEQVTLPNYARTGQLYQGRNRANTCYQEGMAITDQDCGTPYANYTPLEYSNDVVYMNSSTTGVRGGAVVIAIVRVGDNFRRLDSVSYRDPNVPCQRSPTTRWVFGRWTLGSKKVYGWIPTRSAASDGTTAGARQC